ncbi:MAG: beta-galactosidase, partial [Microbacterium sp.]|uniref:beta-galactosidase n=1 Tax=Microbacterium sp. TaxID=51671 RepID=UPI0039E5EE62
MTIDSVRFGGDYNPEQWPREVWDEDVALMQRAGVTSASVGIFSWARLEPRPGEYDFDWLDDVLDTLHAGGIRVLLATATASPPAWLARLHPESLPVTIDGTRLAFGSRQQFSPSSSTYREHAARLVEQLVRRYGAHPAVEAWHVGNEYGCHVVRSYDAESAAAFREWLRARYGTIEHLNDVWATAFWSQRYDSFDEVGVPAQAPTFRNPTQLIDFDRFSSDALLDLYLMEKRIIREHSPNIPVTTNFMGFFAGADYWRWAEHVDVVSDDMYPDPADPRSHISAAAVRDLMRSLGRGRPWLLMEQATSAVNWRERNAPKPAGLYRLLSLQSLLRGADGILHFQWRQSAAGAEKFHSAMVPHAGTDTRVFREVAALGAELGELGELVGQPVPAEVAIVLDWDSWRAVEQEATPAQIDYVETVLRWYEGFLRRGVTVDFVQPGGDTDAYRLLVAPVLHVADDRALAALAAVPERGDVLVVGYQSAVLDENLHVRLGGYLGGAGGPLQRALGVWVEEFAPLPAADAAAALAGEMPGTGLGWQETVRVVDAEVVARFADGFAAGGPAITRRATGAGAAWYVAT